MAELTTDQLKSLEEIRQRLLSLNASLGALRTDLASTLPSWSSLQTHANLITSNLSQINSSLSEHQSLLASTIVFPSLQFPARSQADVISMLLRTKMEPDVEEWFEEGRKYSPSSAGASISGTVGTNAAREGGSRARAQILKEGDRAELWAWAPRAANKEARKQKWGADYTLAEVQGGVGNIRAGLGLKRELVEPEGDEDMDDDDDDDEEDGFSGDGDNDDADDETGDEGEEMNVDPQPGQKIGSSGSRTAAGMGSKEKILRQMPMESVHRFMTTGKVG